MAVKKTGKADDYVKANRKGSRLAELEDSTGWVSKKKIHKSVKTYSRKNKGNIL